MDCQLYPPVSDVSLDLVIFIVDFIEYVLYFLSLFLRTEDFHFLSCVVYVLNKRSVIVYVTQ